jgi:hypothetical protein
MHCEKNLVEHLMNILFGEEDTVAVRRDMVAMNIRSNLWPIPMGNGELELPPAPYVMTADERQTFVGIIQELKAPTSYASSLKKRIHPDTSKLKGLKAHDYHILMQQVLPLCVRTILPKGPRLAIIRLSRVFQRICAKTLDPSSMRELREEAAMTLCILEKEFPPSLFNVMTHLMYHLVEELDLCGPVHTRWMYPIERYMKTLKNFVRNKARPEGSMAEGYSFKESLEFCTEYMKDSKSTKTRVWDDREDPNMYDEMPEGEGHDRLMPAILRDWAHSFVLKNTAALQPWKK